jgi:hypothetical protein
VQAVVVGEREGERVQGRAVHHERRNRRFRGAEV